MEPRTGVGVELKRRLIRWKSINMLRRMFPVLTALALGALPGCAQTSAVTPARRARRVHATVLSRHVQLGRDIRVRLRASGLSKRTMAKLRPVAWWQLWRVRATGATLDPVAMGMGRQKPSIAPRTCTWTARFYVRRGGGRTTVRFEFRGAAPGKTLRAKPLVINIQKPIGMTPRKAAGPLQSFIKLSTYAPLANTRVAAVLTIKNISQHRVTFNAMTCGWDWQWAMDSTAIAFPPQACHRNNFLRHVLAPGKSFAWHAKLYFSQTPRRETFRMGFTPIQRWSHPPPNWIARTYWSKPIHVVVRRAAASKH